MAMLLMDWNTKKSFCFWKYQEIKSKLVLVSMIFGCYGKSIANILKRQKFSITNDVYS